MRFPNLPFPSDREFIRLTNVKRGMKKNVLKDSIYGYAGEYQTKLHSTEYTVTCIIGLRYFIVTFDKRVNSLRKGQGLNYHDCTSLSRPITHTSPKR